MTDKKLFPGVSKKMQMQRIKERVAKENRAHKKAERAKKIADAAKALKEQEELMRARKQRRDAVKSKIDFTTKADEKRANRKVIYKDSLIASFFIGVMAVFMTAVSGYEDYWVPDEDGVEPIVWDGFGAPAGVSGHRETLPVESTFSDITFCVALGALCLIILFVCAMIGVSRKQSKVNKNKDKAIDFMLDILNKNPEYKIDEKRLKKLLKVVPEVISKMSAAERIYFDMLMNGDFEIVNDRTFRNLATSVMEGHLQSHPEEIKRVLEVFDRDSIPQKLLVIGKDNQR